MKKALFFMIFIFATAIYGYAQEAPAAEQNDDKTLDSRHQNRRTMRASLNDAALVRRAAHLSKC